MTEHTAYNGKRYLWLFAAAGAVAALDLWTKHLVLVGLPLNEGVYMTEFFNLVHVRNLGAAFGFLNDPSTPWAARLFLGATVVAAGAILWIARTAKSQNFTAGLGLILGGAVGNAVDRIRFGAVVDFLDFHYKDFHWPAFNVADIGICLGAGIAALYILFGPEGKTPEER